MSKLRQAETDRSGNQLTLLVKFQQDTIHTSWMNKCNLLPLGAEARMFVD